MPKFQGSKIKGRLRELPRQPGVYLMKDRFGTVLYVGKAKDLKKRVATYFQTSRRFLKTQPKIAAMMKLVTHFEHIEVRSEAEALLLEGRLIKEWKPRYKTDFPDDKRFLLVRVDTGNELPCFRLTRIRKDTNSLYFGPFAHSRLLRKTLAEMRRRFGILLGDGTPKQMPDGSWMLYDDARSEIYGHDNIVSPGEYRERVNKACFFLEGKSCEWLAELKQEMSQAAGKKEFEKAAELRDIVFALERTIIKTRKFIREPRTYKQFDESDALEKLTRLLKLGERPQRIECFDISHISGTYVVASMVHFRDGQPDKSNYRRYKIKSFVGNDDYRAMEEVVSRRYLRLNVEKKSLPDLIVIDGGIGQLGAALKAFLAQDLDPPHLIALAKQEETIVFLDQRPPLNLPPHNQARLLLQRIRDEAHRFANTFNAELRSRRLKETILDEFKGIGPVRRNALLAHFKTIKALNRAAVANLQEVDGIGPKLASELFLFLKSAKSTHSR